MQVAEAVESLQSEFRAVDNLVACNSSRVLKAYQKVRVGSHVRKSECLETFTQLLLLNFRLLNFYYYKCWFLYVEIFLYLIMIWIGCAGSIFRDLLDTVTMKLGAVKLLITLLLRFLGPSQPL